VSTRRIALVVATTLLVTAGTAGATKPGSGSSTGTAKVFDVNPVQSLEDESLTDQKDSAAAVPDDAYIPVQLTHLDGSGFLQGDYVRVRSETGNAAYSTTNTFEYTRDQDEFEQVMVYYWLTEAQVYLQSLGFTGSKGILQNGIDARINTYGVDNSFFWDKHHYVRFGKGGVDDAEDAEVILHEYGHAIQDSQVPGFGTDLESGSIGEAFGDYFAVSFGNAKSGNTFQPACVADWDSVSYTSGPIHCLRRTDLDLHWPADDGGEVHRNGRIWSRALWDINQALGNVRADKIIIGAQFSFAADTSFKAAAIATVHYAKVTDLPAVTVVCKAFTDRGFITQADCSSA
jgi:zinc metalloprotease ZmpB